MEEAPSSSQTNDTIVVIEEENTPEVDEKPFKQWRGWLSKQWWVPMLIYASCVLAGQAAGNILGRVYFTNGGNSKWMGTLVQVAGFPLLLPFQWIMTTSKQSEPKPNSRKYHMFLTLIYIVLGVLVALIFWLYTKGLQHLPVSTYTLISATQLVFNVVFSLYINNGKIKPYTINTVVAIIFSSGFLMFGTDPGGSNKTSYIIGCLSASLLYALRLSFQRLAHERFIQKGTQARAIIDMSIYPNIIATIVVLIGLFASGEWRKLTQEMELFKTGNPSYIMNLVFSAVAWQVFTVGSVGLVFEFSSLFSNLISILGLLLLGPVLAMFFLRDKMTGLKDISMVLAIWGFVSYMYSQYRDDRKKKKKEEKKSSEQASQIELVGMT